MKNRAFTWCPCRLTWGRAVHLRSLLALTNFWRFHSPSPSPARHWVGDITECDQMILISPFLRSAQSRHVCLHCVPQKARIVSGVGNTLPYFPAYLFLLLLYSIGPFNDILHKRRVKFTYLYFHLGPHPSFQVGRFLLRNTSDWGMLNTITLSMQIGSFSHHWV